MRHKELGIFALSLGCAFSAHSPAQAQNVQPPASLRPWVPLSDAAATWRAKRLLEAAQMEWQEAQSIAAGAPGEEANSEMVIDFIEDFVDPQSLGLIPPISTQEVTLHLKSYTATWPALDLDEVDLELFEV